ncbi:MAG: nicotinamide-nucleotide amidohydrolase family protein [Gammaproteobacteria bacterium]|jgi:nicotinamide-nucleotide amidase|nr:nicotinamide-nucleotide amidohydrolase family protein [Gammaproteobacteria bacterium]
MNVNNVLVERLAAALSAAQAAVATAESCTGGWIAKTLTDRPGSSGWFGYGFVTYSNQAKMDLLGVPAEVLEAHGAVSEATALAMAAGAAERSGARYSVAVTGIAGPDGGSADKPVGTVWFAWHSAGEAPLTARHVFAGDRDTVRRQTVTTALYGLVERITGER